MSTSSALNPALTATYLRRLGFRTTTAGDVRQAVEAFQAGWNLGPALAVDGIAGVKTSAALAESERRRTLRLPTASEHFGFGEFACTCGGRYPACRWVLVERELLEGLEVLRGKHYPGGMVILSGYRCPERNRAVGGAGASQHMLGRAADFKPVASVAEVRDLREFGGLGWQGGTGPTAGLVRHADTRAGDRARPATWQYA